MEQSEQDNSSRETIEAKHTPGPWRMSEDTWPHPVEHFTIHGQETRPFYTRLGITEREVAYAVSGSQDWKEKEEGDITEMHAPEVEANARLIAAAPTLLEALTFCRSVIKSQGMYELSEQMAFDKANAAITQATGQKPLEAPTTQPDHRADNSMSEALNTGDGAYRP